MNKYDELANSILKVIGGKDNVTYVTHCMTRLRFNIKDRGIIEEEDIKNINGVMGCQFVGGQLQVIIGPGVEKVYLAICDIGGFEKQDTIKENLDNKEKEPFTLKRLGNNILEGITGCLTPIIPVLVTAGLIKMIVALVGPTMFNLVSIESDVYRLLEFVGDAGFYYFPIFVAYSGSKKFGCSPVIALLMAGILLHPTLLEIVASGEPFTVFGLPMTPASYASTVLPMILITWVMSYVEKYLKKFIPDVVATLFVPLLTVLIMLPVGLCLLAPLGSILGIYLGEALMWIRSIFGPFGVALIGALFGLIVVTGMHLPLITTAVISIATIGFDNTILVGGVISTYSSLAVSLAFFLKSKTANEKSLGLSCFVAQSLGGVGEPTLFGIIFRYKKAIVYGMIGTFLGTLYAAFMNVAVYFVASSNFLAVTAFGGGDGSGMIHGIIGAAITFVVTFCLMFFLGYKDKNEVAE